MCAPAGPIPREVPVFTKCPRFAQLHPGIRKAVKVVAVCAGLLAMLAMAAVVVASGLSRP
jgi:hypothetical protein